MDGYFSENEVQRNEIFDFDWYPSSTDEKWKDIVQSLVQEESVQHLDDLIFLHTTFWENPKRALEIAPSICDLFKWNKSRRTAELERLIKKIGPFGGLKN